MNIKRSILSPKQIKEQIAELQRVVNSYLGLSDEELKSLVKRNKDLIHIDPNELSKCMSILRNECRLDEQKIEECFLNCPLIFFDSENLVNKSKLFSDSLGTSPTQFGFIFFNNPKVIMCEDKDVHKFIDIYTVDNKFSPYLVKNLMTKTNFSLQNTYKINQTVKNIKILKTLGFTDEEIVKSPTICGNGTKNMVFRLKIAMLEGLGKGAYLNRKYMLSDEVVYARRKAYEMGIIDTPVVYLKEEEIVKITGFSTGDFRDFFPLGDDGYKEVNEEFALKFPELSELIDATSYGFYDKLQAGESGAGLKLDELLEEERARIQVRREILKLFGAPLILADKKPEIYEETKPYLIQKLKIAKLNNLLMWEFIVSKYQIAPGVLFARWMAKEQGRINVPSIYIFENQLFNQTGLTTQELRKEFKFGHTEKKWLDAEFAKKYPEIDKKLAEILKAYKEKQDEFKRAQNEIEDVAQQSDAEPAKESEDKLSKLIRTNLETLTRYGYERSEIESSPKVLLIKPDKLELRLKLARINGRSNRQFLSKDFSASEETIYARICALYLEKPECIDFVYGTSKQFESVCGHSTAELKTMYPLDERGIRLIDRWHGSIGRQSEDESEQ